KSDEEGRRWRANLDTLSVSMKSVAKTHTDTGRVYLTQGRTRDAGELWLRAAALDRSNTLCRLQLAVHYQHARQPRDALRFYEEATAIDPSDGLIHLNLGRVSQKLGQIDRAERAFKEVIRLAPNQFEGYGALAELYLQLNRNLPEARKLAETAVRLAPDAPNL